MDSVLDVTTWSPELWEEQTSACKQHLENIWETIPLLSDPKINFREGQVVRFRGMIQDGLGHNVHVDKYEVVNELTGDISYRTGKYRQSYYVKPGEKINESGEEKYVDCFSYHCVTVPGLNPWAKESFYCSNNMFLKEKSQGKRVFDEMMEGSTEEIMDVEMKEENKEGDKVEVPKKEKDSCIAKFFEKQENELLLNCVVDMIGFYGVHLQDNDDDKTDDSSKPLILVLHFRKLEHTCPLLPMADFQSEISRIRSSCHAALDNLSALFLPLLQGDVVAFEFLIMNLISHVFLRDRNTELVKGQLCVNFTGIPKNIEYGKKMCDIIKQLVPKTIYLHCSRDFLNSGPLVPFKDYNAEQLVQKPLQLTDGTVIVVDEEAMDEGKLNNHGTNNVMHLREMISKQRLYYDFVYSKVEYNTDYPTIIFSDQKSMLKGDVVVRLRPQQYTQLDEVNAAFEAANQFLKKDSTVTSIREFLASARHAYNLMQDEAMEKFLTEDFVAMRESDPKFTPDDFDRLLLLARWYALSHGKDRVDAEAWKDVKLLDQSRIDNLTS